MHLLEIKRQQEYKPIRRSAIISPYANAPLKRLPKPTDFSIVIPDKRPFTQELDGFDKSKLARDEIYSVRHPVVVEPSPPSPNLPSIVSPAAELPQIPTPPQPTSPHIPLDGSIEEKLRKELARHYEGVPRIGSGPLFMDNHPVPGWPAGPWDQMDWEPAWEPAPIGKRRGSYMEMARKAPHPPMRADLVREKVLTERNVEKLDIPRIPMIVGLPGNDVAHDFGLHHAAHGLATSASDLVAGTRRSKRKGETLMSARKAPHKPRGPKPSNLAIPPSPPLSTIGRKRKGEPMERKRKAPHKPRGPKPAPLNIAAPTPAAARRIRRDTGRPRRSTRKEVDYRKGNESSAGPSPSSSTSFPSPRI